MLGCLARLPTVDQPSTGQYWIYLWLEIARLSLAGVPFVCVFALWPRDVHRHRFKFAKKQNKAVFVWPGPLFYRSGPASWTGPVLSSPGLVVLSGSDSASDVKRSDVF